MIRAKGSEVFGDDSSIGPNSRLATFAAPLVTRRVKISAWFGSLLVTRHPLDETEISVLSGHVEDSTTGIGPGSINRGSIFAM
jgi:hypothetical protein